MATSPTFFESFDNGLGAFSRAWGPGVDTSVPGQLTIRSAADNSDSGAMMPPTGASQGFGYGLYTETLQMNNVIGPYGMAGWPSSDVWPGPELDMVEIDNNGVPYGTVHWKGADGSNQYRSVSYNGVDPTQKHVYQMDWQADRISFFVDGALQGTVTENVPKDFAHGGENESMGVGMQTWWNNGALGGQNWITIFDASYTQTSDGGAVVPGPVTPGPVTPGPVTPTPVPPTPATPVDLAAGTGADALVLKIGQDAYQGDAQYTVSVDGQQVGGTFTASASHAAGQSDTLTLKGDWAAGAHQVAVRFLNDAWDGTAATDRNLYVVSATYNGLAVPGAAQAIVTDAQAGGFGFTEAAAPVPTAPSTPAPVSLTAGAGPDSLVLKLSQDAYQGSAQYTVKVDGQQVGGAFTAFASHSAGRSDTLTLKGDWAAGAHQVSVEFLNDKWDGTAATDRNLYVDAATYNGQALAGASKALMSAGSAAIGFTEGSVSNLSLQGTAGGDSLAGADGADRLRGLAGNDTLSGGAGNDALNGGAGNDVLNGGAGNDYLLGGSGADTLTGGAGPDRFAFLSAAAGGDTVLDFSVADGDRLDLRGVFAASGQGYAGLAAGGFLKAEAVSGGVLVSVDADGGGDGYAALVTLNGLTAAALGTDFLIA